MPGWTRDTPWRQGHVLTRDAVDKLGLTCPDSPTAIVVVVSHTCDVVQSPATEPDLEVLYGRPITTSDGNCTHAKNPRKLHLPFNIPGGELMVELQAPEKFVLPKKALVDFVPDPDIALLSERLSTLQRWLAARYRRTAFPDAFDRRFDTTGMKDKLTKILSRHGKHIHAVFFDVDDGEEIKREAPEDTYTLDIYLLFDSSSDLKSAKDDVSQARKEIIKAFQGTLIVEGEGWQYIELRDCIPLSDEEMSYKQSLYFKKWNLDYVSLRDPSQAEPAE